HQGDAPAEIDDVGAIDVDGRLQGVELDAGQLVDHAVDAVVERVLHQGRQPAQDLLGQGAHEGAVVRDAPAPVELGGEGGGDGTVDGAGPGPQQLDHQITAEHVLGDPGLHLRVLRQVALHARHQAGRVEGPVAGG